MAVANTTLRARRSRDTRTGGPQNAACGGPEGVRAVARIILHGPPNIIKKTISKYCGSFIVLPSKCGFSIAASFTLLAIIIYVIIYVSEIGDT